MSGFFLRQGRLRRHSLRRQQRIRWPGRRFFGFRLFRLTIAAVHSLGHRCLRLLWMDQEAIGAHIPTRQRVCRDTASIAASNRDVTSRLGEKQSDIARCRRSEDRDTGDMANQE